MQTQFACIMRSKGKSELQKFVYHIYLFFSSLFFLQSKLIKNEYATSWASAAFINCEGWTKIVAFLADFLCFPCRVLCVLTTLITLPSIAGTPRHTPRRQCLHPQVTRTIDVINKRTIYIHTYIVLYSTDISAWQVTTYNFRSETSGLQLSYEYFYFI